MGAKFLCTVCEVISRSATASLAYLVKYKDLPLRQAFLTLKSKRPMVRPHRGFWRSLLELERSVRGNTSVKLIFYPGGTLPDVYNEAGSVASRVGENSSIVLDQCGELWLLVSTLIWNEQSWGFHDLDCVILLNILTVVVLGISLVVSDKLVDSEVIVFQWLGCSSSLSLLGLAWFCSLPPCQDSHSKGHPLPASALAPSCINVPGSDLNLACLVGVGEVSNALCRFGFFYRWYTDPVWCDGILHPGSRGNRKPVLVWCLSSDTR